MATRRVGGARTAGTQPNILRARRRTRSSSGIHINPRTNEVVEKFAAFLKGEKLAYPEQWGDENLRELVQLAPTYHGNDTRAYELCGASGNAQSTACQQARRTPLREFATYADVARRSE